MAFPAALETDRLRMRPTVLADAEEIFARYSHDLEVCRYLAWRPHQSVADAVDYLTRRLSDDNEGKSVSYLIFLRETDALLGAVGGRVQSSLIQFGYCLARSEWGKGYATEAARAFVAAAIEQPEIWRVQAFCDLENPASARVLEKAGLTLEGILRRYMQFPNLGEAPRDVYCYARVR